MSVRRWCGEEAAIPLPLWGGRGRRALEASWDMVFEVDLTYGILLTGPGRWRSVLDIPAGPDYDRTIALAARRCVHPGDAGRFVQTLSLAGLRRAFSGGGPVLQMSFRRRGLWGRGRRMHCVIWPVRDRAGRPIRALGAMRWI